MLVSHVLQDATFMSRDCKNSNHIFIRLIGAAVVTSQLQYVRRTNSCTLAVSDDVSYYPWLCVSAKARCGD